jgi:hypothetical protein
MERGSDVHNPRIDEELRHETDSLTHGAPVEARVEESRLQEDWGDDDLPVESVVGRTVEAPVDNGLTHTAVRERSELARHLRGSIFPADRTAIVQCAVEEHAPPDMVAALRRLPAGEYLNVEGVWEALGGQREHRESGVEPETEPRVVRGERAAASVDSDEDSAEPESVQRFEFRFDGLHRLAAAPFLVSPATSVVTVDRRRGRFTARFGPWRVETALENIASTETTGSYTPLKTVGPAHLSLSDRGLTFATNDQRGLCIRFHTPVRGIDPLGVIRHPGLTVTVDDVDGLRTALEPSSD